MASSVACGRRTTSSRDPLAAPLARGPWCEARTVMKFLSHKYFMRSRLNVVVETSAGMTAAARLAISHEAKSSSCERGMRERGGRVSARARAGGGMGVVEGVWWRWWCVDG